MKAVRALLRAPGETMCSTVLADETIANIQVWSVFVNTLDKMCSLRARVNLKNPTLSIQSTNRDSISFSDFPVFVFGFCFIYGFLI